MEDETQARRHKLDARGRGGWKAQLFSIVKDIALLFRLLVEIAN